MSWKRNYFASGGGGGTQGISPPRTMTSIAPSKGSSNEPGQNSCFSNSASQVSWHSDIFRRSFRQLTTHKCMEDSCIFCASKNIFSQFQYSSEKVSPSDASRSASAKTFQDEQRFQLGIMDDAAECFENISMRIHFHISDESKEDICTARHCIPHQKFAMTLFEQCVCSSCGASSDPSPFIQMVHYISTTSLCNQAVKMSESREKATPSMFGESSRNASMGDLRSCPSRCGQQLRMARVLLNSPEIITIGSVWDSDHSESAEDVIHSSGTCSRLGDMFYKVTEEKARQAELYSVGMVCYYGKHYSTFFFQTKIRRWMYFDDADVKEIGPKWKDVVSRCIKGHYQPSSSLYADPRGTPVSSQDSPPPRLDSQHSNKASYDSEDSGREPSISSDTRTDSSTESYSGRHPSYSHHESSATHYSSDSQGTVVCMERPDRTSHASLCSSDAIGHATADGETSPRKGGGAVSRRRSSSRSRRLKPEPSAGYHSDGETLKEQQVPRHLPKPPPSSSSTSRLRDFKETMTSIIRPSSSSSSSSSSPAAVLSSEISSPAFSQHLPASNTAPSSSSARVQDWEADSTSSESKSSSYGGAGRYRPAWRPRRETLNIDTIFTRERRRQAGYSPSGGPLPDDGASPDASSTAQEELSSTRPGASRTLPSSFKGAQLPAPPPPPPRSIQRMESGYESSERNSSSPVSSELHSGDRDSAVKKPSSSSSSSGPSWRNTRSKSSGSSSQDLHSSSRGSLAPPAGRSESDESQEEVSRKAREEEQQRRQEKEREVASGFNPRPSKFSDSDSSQVQGKGDSFDRCVTEAELSSDQSVRLEQAGEVAAASSAVNEAVSKSRPVAAEGGASSHSRSQRCMRRARSSQQRMQSQQQKEQQQAQEQQSEKPLPLPVLSTDNQGDQSAAHQDHQAPPPVTCLVKPLPPAAALPSDSASSPATDTRTRSPCSRFGKPLSSARSLPALSVDSSSEDVAPPPPPGEEWPISSQAPPNPRPRSQTPSPADSNSRGHVMMVEDSLYTPTKQTTPIDCNPAPRLAPPPCPTRKWSCLSLDQPDVDSPRPSISSGSAPTPPPVNSPTSTCSPPANQVHRAASPVECWADNVNRYYSSQNAAGGGTVEEGEELSESETLYQASSKAPSMHRGSRGVSPQPGGSRPGVRRMPSGPGRSKTPTAEIERYAYNSPVSPVQKPPAGEDENYSAENSRRLARSSSGTVIGSRPQNSPRSCDPSVSRPPLRHSDLHRSSSSPLHHPSTSSSHPPSSTSFTADHSSLSQPRHHGPPAPQHPHMQTSRPPSSGSSSWGRSGAPRRLQHQVSVSSDRSQTPSGLHSVPLNYATLPRPPRRAPASSSSLPRTTTDPAVPMGPQSLYATSLTPRRSTITSSSHHQQASLPAPQRPRVSGDVPAQPLRSDVPPETDWRCHVDHRTSRSSSSWDPRSVGNQQRPHWTDRGPYRGPQLCWLCRQLPADPSGPYCPTCAADVARYRSGSKQ